MMKKLFSTASLILALSLLLCSCGPQSGSGNISLGGAENRHATESSKIAVFTNGEVHGFWARNDRGNGPPFNCAFYRDNAIIANGMLTLALKKQGDIYVGAEYRSQQRFGYGFYAVRMKAAACPGVISSFFTYTGFPWDEIDIEFLGDDTTKVQFNYYTNGIGHHEYVYYLGFDASEDFHEYAFDWQPDSITWYVDGRPVYRASVNIPSTPGQIMVNLWNVADTNADWAGRFDGSRLPVYAQYEWFAYEPAE